MTDLRARLDAIHAAYQADATQFPEALVRLRDLGVEGRPAVELLTDPARPSERNDLHLSVGVAAGGVR